MYEIGAGCNSGNSLTMRFMLLTMLNAVKKIPPVLSENKVTVQNFNFVC